MRHLAKNLQCFGMGRHGMAGEVKTASQNDDKTLGKCFIKFNMHGTKWTITKLTYQPSNGQGNYYWNELE